jgi:acetyltransferase-like isoleucine patch superfamily enzyme
MYELKTRSIMPIKTAINKTLARLLGHRLVASSGLLAHLIPNSHMYTRGQQVAISRTARLDLHPCNTFRIGSRSSIEDYCALNNFAGDLTIGENVFIGIGNIIIGPVELGNNIMTAQHVVISGMNHQYENIAVPIREQGITTEKITIEDDCWIGAQCVITAGVTIGRHSVVAGGSVVTRSIPPYSMAGGNPATILKAYNPHTCLWEKPVSQDVRAQEIPRV